MQVPQNLQSVINTFLEPHQLHMVPGNDPTVCTINPIQKELKTSSRVQKRPTQPRRTRQTAQSARTETSRTQRATTRQAEQQETRETTPISRTIHPQEARHIPAPLLQNKKFMVQEEPYTPSMRADEG